MTLVARRANFANAPTEQQSSDFRPTAHRNARLISNLPLNPTPLRVRTPFYSRAKAENMTINAKALATALWCVNLVSRNKLYDSPSEQDLFEAWRDIEYALRSVSVEAEPERKKN
jgi:hypothetical protein